MGITHQYFIIIDTVAARNYACYSREGHCKKKHTCQGPESTGSSMSIKHDKGLITTSITTKSLLSLLLSFVRRRSITSRFPVNLARHNNINSTRKTSTESLFVLQIRSGCFRNITTIDIFQTEDYTFHSEPFTTTVTHYSYLWSLHL